MSAWARPLPFQYALRWPSMRQTVDDELSPEFARMNEERDRELEDFLATLGAAAAGVYLNLRGQVTSVETDRVYPPSPLAPLAPGVFHASLSAYAGGTVTVELRKNGVAVASLNPAGSGPVEAAITETWSTADYATIAVTSWAAGARGLVAGLF
jgi:hypothetical protein